MSTRSGNFPIGFRRAGVEWQKDLGKLAKWSKQAGFDVIDFTHRCGADDIATLKSAGLAAGSVDLLDFGQIMAGDAGKRKEVLDANLKFVKEAAAQGAKAFFTCLIPGDPTKDLKAIKTVRMVVKDGVVFFPSEIHAKFGILPFATPPVVTTPEGAQSR